MSTERPPPVRTIRFARPAIAVAIAVLVTFAAAPAGASGASRSAPATPQLSITVDDGERSAKTDDELSYTVTVKNLGATALTDLHVTQTMPVGLSPSSSDPKGVVEPGSIAWSVDLAANGSVQLRSVATVSDTPAATLRLASVGCAAVTADAPPLVCATDSDLLPAGSAAEAEAEEATDRPDDERSVGTAAGSTGRTVVPFVVAGGIVAVAVAVGAMAARRRAARRRSAREAEGEGALGTFEVSSGAVATSGGTRPPGRGLDDELSSSRRVRGRVQKVAGALARDGDRSTP